MRSKASGSVGGGRRLAAEANQRRASVRRTGPPARRQSWARSAQAGRSRMPEALRTPLRGEAAEDLAEIGIGVGDLRVGNPRSDGAEMIRPVVGGLTARRQ